VKVGNLIRWKLNKKTDPRTGNGPCLIISQKRYDLGVNNGYRFHLLVGEQVVSLMENYVFSCYEIIS